MRQYKKLLKDLEEWHDWCMDNPNEKRRHIAYHLEKLLEEVKK